MILGVTLFYSPCFPKKLIRKTSYLNNSRKCCEEREWEDASNHWDELQTNPQHSDGQSWSLTGDAEVMGIPVA